MKTVTNLPTACPECRHPDLDRKDALGAIWLFCNSGDCLWMDVFTVVRPEQGSLFGDRQLSLAEAVIHA